MHIDASHISWIKTLKLSKSQHSSYMKNKMTNWVFEPRPRMNSDNTKLMLWLFTVASLQNQISFGKKNERKGILPRLLWLPALSSQSISSLISYTMTSIFYIHISKYLKGHSCKRSSNSLQERFVVKKWVCFKKFWLQSRLILFHSLGTYWSTLDLVHCGCHNKGTQFDCFQITGMGIFLKFKRLNDQEDSYF